MAFIVSVASNSPAWDGWEQIVGDGHGGGNGFGDPLNSAVSSMVVHQGFMLAAVANHVEGAGIWKSENGVSWSPILDGGFGDPDNFSILALASFGGRVWAATSNLTSGCEIWSSEDLVTWVPEMTSGFGDPDNTHIFFLVEYQDSLYTSTANNPIGLQVWRLSSGTGWQRVGGPGFGDPNNRHGSSSAVFGGKLYVGVGNYDEGAGIWKLVNESSFVQVLEGGLGVSDLGDVDFLLGFSETLFAGASTSHSAVGGYVWYSPDGSAWDVHAASGFGDPLNTYLDHAANDETNLFVCVSKFYAYLVGGLEVYWTNKAGSWRQIASNGFGDFDNSYCGSMIVFNHQIYVGTVHSGGGLEIWSTRCPLLADGLESGDTSAWSGVEPPMGAR
jgi:hypothetical protein